MTRLAQRKHLLLTLILIVMVIRQSFPHRLTNSVISDGIANLLVLAVLLVVFERRFERHAAFLVAALTISMQWTRYITPDSYLLWDGAANHVLLIGFLGFAVAVILRNIFEKKMVTSDAVLGAVCGYLLAGTAWGNVYELTELLQPGSFHVAPALAHQLATAEGRSALFGYFSLVTLTTMGFGDVTPGQAPTSALVTLEAVFGQFYIAVVVAQLVGLRLAQALASSDEE